MRAAMSACSVSGIRSAPPLPATLDEHAIVSSTNSGLPSVRSRTSFGRAGGGSPVLPRAGRAASRRALALLLRQRLELDRRRADAPSTPARPRLEQLRPGEADDEQRRPHPVRKMLDEVEERSSAQWMSSKRRMSGCTSASVCITSRAAHAISCGLRSPSGFHHPRRQPQHVRDRLLGAALAELLERLLERVVVGDARCRLDHLCERPVRDALAVGERATDEAARALDAVDELAGEAALADPGSP